MAKTSARSKTGTRASANDGAMPVPLPLSTNEKGITRNASRALISVHSSIIAACSSVTTPDAVTSFWSALRDYASRNLNNFSGASAPPTRKTRAATA